MIAQLFCRHQWKLESKAEYKNHLERIPDNIRRVVLVEETTETIEVRVCGKCGKINVLKY